MNDVLLVGVLHGMADGDEEAEPFGSGQVGLVTVLGDLDAADQFHHKKGRPIGVAPASSTRAMLG